MSQDLGWLQMNDTIFGVSKHMITSVEWTFDLWTKLRADSHLEATWAEKLNNLNPMNSVWVLFGCHMSFLSSTAKANHAFHVVCEIYNRSKVINATSQQRNDWRFRPDTSDDAFFRLVYQYDTKFQFLREGAETYVGPARPPGINRPVGFDQYQSFATELATGVKSAHGL